LESFALFPSSLTTKGCVWIRLSPWVWIPTLACWFGLSAGFSNCGSALSHSPQTFTWNAVCQWSPATFCAASGARGGPLPALSPPPRTRMTATMPTMMSTAMATFHPKDPLRRRFGLRYRERIAARW
jgi:hypothetical protein